MRPALSLAIATLLAGPAMAQSADQPSDGERLFRGILDALTTPQTEQQAQPGSGPQTAGALFAVTDLHGRAVCDMTFTGSGPNGTVQPGSNCPGALRVAERWDQPGDDLALRDSANRLLWRGEPAPGANAWTGGAADTLRVYTIAPGAAAGPSNQGGQAADPFTQDELYGDWRVTEPGQAFGCRITFEAPDPDSAFAVSNAIRTRAGCPGDVFTANRWVYSNGVLTLTDAFGNRNAELRRSSRDRWTGTSDGVDIVMTRS